MRRAARVCAQGSLDQLLRQVTPGRFDAYESLLHTLAESRVWMLLWSGHPGSPDAQYANMEVAGYGYAPCVTSPRELAASGWDRAHEVVTGREIAAALFPARWGVWLNPHAQGAGLGVPWLDLRRIAVGLDQLPAGPLRIAEPSLDMSQFYGVLTEGAHRTPAVRSLRRCWVRPAWGAAFLALGVDLYDSGGDAVAAVRQLVHRALPAAPQGVPVSTVSMADDYDPVAMWLRRNSQPFFDRDLHAGAPQAPLRQGYGFPGPH